MNIVQEESSRGRKKNERRFLAIEIARRDISANGLKSLRVRDVAEAVGAGVSRGRTSREGLPQLTLEAR